MKSDLFVFSLILSISRDVAAAADAEVVCEYNMNCILPCRFQYGSDIVIHWMKVEKTGKNIPLISFMKEKVHPKEGFMNRTSLFMEEILNGNASVQLREVKIQDGGRYMCYVSIFSKEQAEKSFINLKVNEKSTISTGEILAIVAAIFVVLFVAIGVVGFVCDKIRRRSRERDAAARGMELNHMMGGENQL